MNEIASVEQVAVGDLVAFVESAESDRERYELMPISRARAIAHAHNPVACKEDVGLLVAYDRGKCVGFLGVFPCAFDRDGKRSKVFALSTFYVVEEYRKRGVAMAIMKAAIALDYDFVLAGFTPPAEKFYRKNSQWFEYAGALPYSRIHAFPVVTGLGKLARKFPRMSRELKALQKVAASVGDRGARRSILGLARARGRANFERCQFVSVDQVPDVGAVSVPRSDSVSGGLVRGAAVVNAMLREPWIGEGTPEPARYPFAETYELFRFLAFSIVPVSAEVPCGYAVFSVARQDVVTVLKILDVACNAGAYQGAIYSQVLDQALRLAARWNADTIEASNDFSPEIARHPWLRLLVERKHRGYFVHRRAATLFGPAPTPLRLSYCDGDSPFT